MTKAADLALGKIAALKTALIEFTDGDDAIAVADAGVVTLLTTAVAKSEGGAVTHNIAQGLAKAWINLNGKNTIATRDSFNISGITDNGNGDYTNTFSNNLGNVNFCATGTCTHLMGTTARLRIVSGYVWATSSIRVITGYTDTNITDHEVVGVEVNGDLA